MRQLRIHVMAIAIASVLGSAVAGARAAVSEANQQALRTKFVGKVLVFRKSFRDVSKLDVTPEGKVQGDHQPGYWSVDAVLQVKDLQFGKDRVIFKCAKLWANATPDNHLRFFPASVALKGKTDYAENEEIVFHTGIGDVTPQALNQQVGKVFLSEKDSVLGTAPQPIASYIEGVPAQVDIDPASATGFSGTPPKVVSNPTPQLPREALLVGQGGHEGIVVYVDERGAAAVVGFTRLLHYGIEEATIEGVRHWKFEPAVKDGHPVPVRIAVSIDYSSSQKK
jgi:hypothetical protein